MLYPVVFTLMVAARALAQVPPMAVVTNGTVQGIRCSNADANAFLGVPYARAPIGDLRFAAPAPYNKKYDGTLIATNPSPSCVQFSRYFGTGGAGVGTEDCLFLDIYAPTSATISSFLPVKLWLYGGSNHVGSVSDDLYNGCPAAAAGDAIIVAANYRLGPLGFLVIPDTNITGNQALQDQLLAARWVRDNIVAFGGDRERILLFGQSAGARDTAVLATLPASGGLLAAAAMESGGFGKDIPRAVDRTGPHARWARDVGCAARDVGCLRAAPMDVLVAAARNVSSAGWGPVVDGTMVTQQPAAAGLAVPAIVGVTTAETANGLLERVGGPGVMARLDGTVYNEFLQQMFRGQAGAVNASYSLARFYTNTSMLYGADADAARGAAVFRAIVRIQTEREYLCPLQKGLRAEAARGGRSPGVWGYVWDQAPGCAWLGGMDADTARVLGPAHSSEIPYVFGEVAALPPGGLGNCGFDDGDRNISRFVMRAWTHMATKGRPVDVDGSWPRFVQGKGNEKGLTIRNGRVIPGTLDFTACDFWARVDASLKASSGSAFGTSWSVRDLTLAFVLVRLASMVVF